MKFNLETYEVGFPLYTSEPISLTKKYKFIADFLSDEVKNVDHNVVESFGEEWSKFNSFTEEEIKKIGNEYFDIIPPTLLNKNTSVLDVGCGTGRWSKYLADKVNIIDAVDPSKAIFAADELLKENNNIRLTKATSSTLPFPSESYDLVMSVGVLHHIPDTLQAMKDCVAKVKKGGFFYTYLYYNLDNRSISYKVLFKLTDGIRKIISKLPSSHKKFACDLLAIVCYMPFVITARAFNKLKFYKVSKKIPLNYYANKSFFVIRNDALDRFGTKLEHRFSKKEIEAMLLSCGLRNIVFSSNPPYWHVIAQKDDTNGE